MNQAILEALQFSYIHSRDPINTTSDPRYLITYQYATTSQPDDLPTSTVFGGWTALTAAEKAAIEAQFDYIETVLNVRFVEVSGEDDPDMNLGKVTIPGQTVGFGGNSITFSGNTILSWDGFAVFDNTLDISQASQINLILHEIAHALGLKHPFEGSATLPAATENNKFTVMSYTDNPDNGAASDALMLYDIFALQDIWGATDHRTGNTTYDGPRTTTVDSVWDTGGTDIFDASAKTTEVTLDLREGEFSTFGTYPDVVITFGTLIENATGGSGNDTLTGNAANNLLKGGRGNDEIVAGLGKDTLRGDQGKDTLKGQSGNDTLRGGNGNDRLLGGGGKDDLEGQKGRDKLDGQKGDDDLTGNQGKDVFYFRKNGDNDTILDFQDDIDVIRVKKLGNLSSVLDSADQIGSDVVFDFGGGDTLTVLNTTLNAISDDVGV